MRGAVRNRGRNEDGKTNDVNDLHSFRGYAADVGLSRSRATAQQTSGNMLGTYEIQLLRFCTSCCQRLRSSGIRGTSTKLKQPSETTGIKHLRCRLCCARRFATSQAFALAYRRNTASVSSATWAVLGCRVASSPSDAARSVSLDFSTSAAVERCDGCCRVFDGRSTFRSKRAFSCPNAGQVARRRTMRDATQGVCCLIFTPSAQDVAALSV